MAVFCCVSKARHNKGKVGKRALLHRRDDTQCTEKGRKCVCVCVRGRVTEQACVSVNEGYVKAISGLFNLSERELAHFHNHHLSFSDPPHFFAEKPTAQDRETSLCGI